MPGCRASSETTKKDVRVHERKMSAFGDKIDGDPVHGRSILIPYFPEIPS